MPKSTFPKGFGYKSLSICLIITSFIILISQWLQLGAEKEIIQEVNEHQLIIVRKIASEIETLMKDLENKAVTWAAIHPFARLTKAEIANELNDFYQLTHEKVICLGILNPKGKYEYFHPSHLQREMKEKDFSQRDFFRQAILKAKNKDTSNIPYLGFSQEMKPGTKTISLSLPLYIKESQENGEWMRELLGVLVIFIDLSSIDSICQSYHRLHQSSSFWLIDEQGYILSHATKAWIGRSIFELNKGGIYKGRVPKLDWIVQYKMLKGYSGTDMCLDDLETHYLNYTPVQGGGGKKWSMAVSTPETKMYDWQKGMLKSAWQWWISIISFVLVCISFIQGIIILVQRKKMYWEKEQRQKYQKIFDGISDVVYILDHDYNLQMANQAFKKICGTSDRELEGKKCFEFIKGRKTPCPDCPIPIKEANPMAIYQLDQALFQKNAHLCAYPLANDHGQEAQSVIIFARLIKEDNSAPDSAL